MAQPVILAAILSLMAVLSPEWQMTAELRTVSSVIVERQNVVTGERIVRVFHQPAFLDKLRVTRIHEVEIEGQPAMRIRFGNYQWWWVWPRPNLGDLSDENGIALDVEEKFIQELLREVLN